MDSGNYVQHKRYKQYMWEYYQVHPNNFVETGLSAVLLLNMCLWSAWLSQANLVDLLHSLYSG